MICRFCGEQKKLIKAHVIPEGFFRRMRDGQNPPQLLTNMEGEYPKRAPIGVYDSGILCEVCEPIFGAWDAYAQQFMAEEPAGGQPLYVGSQLVGYKVQSYDYRCLKLFFMSLIWRASVSQQAFFKRVSLGPYEDVALNLIKHCAEGSEDQFTVTLAKFDHPIGISILDPHPEKPDGVNYYCFYLGSYVAYIKVDRRRAPKPYIDFMLSENPPLYIILRHLERSKEWPLIHNIATAANKRLQPPR